MAAVAHASGAKIHVDAAQTVGKIGIDATVKSKNAADFERAWPVNWGKVKLEDYL